VNVAILCTTCKRKVHIFSGASAHYAAFNGTVVTDRANVSPRPQQPKPAVTDFDLRGGWQIMHV